MSAAAYPLAAAGMSAWLCQWSERRWAEAFPGFKYVSGWAWVFITLFAGVGAALLLIVAVVSAVAARTLYVGDVVEGNRGPLPADVLRSETSP